MTVFTLAVTVFSIAFFVLVPGCDLSQPMPTVYHGFVFLAPGLIAVAIISVLQRSPLFGQQFRIHRNGVSESQGSKSEYILYDEVTHISHHVTDHAKERFIDVRILSVNKSVRGTFSVAPGSRKETAVLALVKRLKKPY